MADGPIGRLTLVVQLRLVDKRGQFPDLEPAPIHLQLTTDWTAQNQQREQYLAQRTHVQVVQLKPIY